MQAEVDIYSLSTTGRLPLTSSLRVYGNGQGSGAKYGEVRGGGGAGGESAARVEALRDKVVELGKLEVAVQQSYFAIKGRFGSKRQKTAT